MTTDTGGEWLTVSEAAARLDISERQARRYAGRLAANDRREPDTTPDMGPDVKALHVRLSAIAFEREKTKGPDTKSKTPDMGADTTPDTLHRTPDTTPDAQRVAPDAGPDIATVEVLRDVVEILREQLATKDKQLEALQTALLNEQQAHAEARRLHAGTLQTRILEAPSSSEGLTVNTGQNAPLAPQMQTLTGLAGKVSPAPPTRENRAPAAKRRGLLRRWLGIR